MVEDITTKKQYAMKMLDKDKIAKENLEDDVLSEVRSMKLVHHPYIVRLFEVLKTNKKILLLMEYMDGGDLFDAISKFYYDKFLFVIESEKENAMTEEKARLYFQQIILAVKYLHNKNIIHRDLKPENILIDRVNNSIKITDFGLSALINRKDQLLPDIAGTTDYLAPEVIKQTGYLGQSADIWSCGVILYNCVTGNKPFVGSNSVMLNNILTGNAEFCYNKISNSLIDLLTKIFDPNPSTRYTIEKIMEHEWFLPGFETVKEYVDLFLSKNKEEDLLISQRKTLQYITTVYLNQKEISFDLAEIPVVNCFELGLLMYGRSVGNMFNSQKKHFNDTKNFGFICKKGVDACCIIIKDYFFNQEMEVDFTKIDKDKFIINVLYKDTVISMLLQLIKINSDNKCLFIVSYQNGITSDYYKIMYTFFEKNKNSIEKF